MLQEDYGRKVDSGVSEESLALRCPHQEKSINVGRQNEMAYHSRGEVIIRLGEKLPAPLHVIYVIPFPPPSRITLVKKSWRTRKLQEIFSEPAAFCRARKPRLT